MAMSPSTVSCKRKQRDTCTYYVILIQRLIVVSLQYILIYVRNGYTQRAYFKYYNKKSGVSESSERGGGESNNRIIGGCTHCRESSSCSYTYLGENYTVKERKGYKQAPMAFH